jgi:hypothetical protein
MSRCNANSSSLKPNIIATVVFGFSLALVVVVTGGGNCLPTPRRATAAPPSTAVGAIHPAAQSLPSVNLWKAGLQATGHESSPEVKTQILENYSRLPLSFEPNQGQAAREVKFLSRGAGYALSLTPTEAVLSLKDSGVRPGASPMKRTADHGPRTADLSFRMKLVGADPAPLTAGVDELPGKSNYFLGSDPEKWRTNVPNYAKVRYQDVYPGVDLVYYGKQGKLEYDFVVAPGADPNSIKLSFQGAERIAIDEETGDLVLSAHRRELRFHKPLALQPATTNGPAMVGTTARGPRAAEVKAEYVLAANHQVHFQVSPYDRSRPLVIDPSFPYTTYLGGTLLDQGFSIAVDSTGNAYVGGTTGSANFPITKGAYLVAGVPSFVSKLNSSGSSLIYSTYFSGALITGLAVDPSGNAYLTGNASSTLPIFPSGTPCHVVQCTFGGANTDAFAAKLNAAGSGLIYSTFLGGSGNDKGSGIAVDDQGNAYLTGITLSSDFFHTTPNGYSTACSSCPTLSDAFVTEINSTGSALLYSTFLGGGNTDQGLGIALDNHGKIYVTGFTLSTNFPATLGAFQSLNKGGGDAFVTKLDPTLSGSNSLVYSTCLGGVNQDVGQGIAVDSAGNAYIAGFTVSSDFPTSLGAFQTSKKGAVAAFVTKLNPFGTTALYSTYLSGSKSDAGVAIFVDRWGNAYLTGSATSPDFPTVLPVQPVYGGAGDAFVAKLNRNGSALLFSSYLGGSGVDLGNGISADPCGGAFVVGQTTSTNLSTTSGAKQIAYGGGPYDAFVAKIGTAPVTDLSALLLSFAPQALRTSSKPQIVTLTNRGSVPLMITGIGVIGDYSEADTCGSALAPRASCVISITFRPVAAGERDGTLTINADGVCGPRTVKLLGLGMPTVGR